VKTRIVRIGNSRGIRIPKLLLDQAGLAPDAEVELRASSQGLEIRPASRPRTGWAEAAARARATGEGELLDAPTPTRFDTEQWRW
jgi:antitoxin MazE